MVCMDIYTLVDTDYYLVTWVIIILQFMYGCLFKVLRVLNTDTYFLCGYRFWPNCGTICRKA